MSGHQILWAIFWVGFFTAAIHYDHVKYTHKDCKCKEVKND